MLVCFWSPKGGSGTSVIAAAAALVLAREGRARRRPRRRPARRARVGDRRGAGLRDWLCAGPEAPTDALDRLALDAGRGLTLLPAGAGDVAAAIPGSGRRARGRAAGRPAADDRRRRCARRGPSLRCALVEVADASVIVVRGCYLALRRAVRLELTANATGAVFVDEGGRALGAHDVANVLGVPVLATCRRARLDRARDRRRRAADPSPRRAGSTRARGAAPDRRPRPRAGRMSGQA